MTGSDRSGTANPSARLTEAQVVSLRTEAEAGAGYPELMDRYGLSKAAVYRILYGKLWPKAGGPIRTVPGHPGIPRALTAEKAREIRQAVVGNGESQKDVAARYGVSTNAVFQVVHGRTWKDAGGPVVPLVSRPAQRRAYVTDRSTDRRYPDRRGTANPSAVLTEAQVVALRQACADGVPQQVIAYEYGVSTATVSRIVHGDRWKHAGGPIKTPVERTTV